MLFSLPSNPSPSDISDALNYLLSNFGSNVSINTGTGSVAGPTGNISYLYQYLDIKYAQSFDGSVGFSNVPTNATYFGVRNSNSPTESTNPSDYLWQEVTGGFGTTNFLYYATSGGRQIVFQVASTLPSQYYVQDTGSAINLDIVTTTQTVNAALASIYIWTSGTAPARPTTTSTYTWATGSYTAPTGWTTTPSSNSTAGWVQWAIFIPLTASTNTATSLLDWTNTSYGIIQYSSNGSTGTTGPRTNTGILYYANSQATAPAAPTLSGYNFATGTFSSISSGWSTTFTAPTATYTSQFWAVSYYVVESTYGGSQTITTSSVYNWTNFNGLVSFTNLATTTGTTFINGGNITTNTINANSIEANTAGAYNNGYWSLGSTTTFDGFTATLDLNNSTNGNFAAIIVHEATSGTNACALASGTRSFNSPAAIFNNVNSSNLAVSSIGLAYGSAVASANYGLSGQSDSSWAQLGISNNGVFGAFVGTFPNSTGQRLTDGLVGTLGAGGQFRYLNSDGTTVKYQLFCGTASYSAYSPSGGGKIYIVDGNGPFTGFHEGLIPLSSSVELGDILFDVAIYKKEDINNTVTYVDVTNTVNQKGVIGVCSQIYNGTPPQSWLTPLPPPDPQNPKTADPTPPSPPPPQTSLVPDGYMVVHINALGEGQMNVCGLGGNISKGDLIVASSMAGKGMKQSDDVIHSYTVAKAREDMVFDSPTQVNMIACIYVSG